MSFFLLLFLVLIGVDKSFSSCGSSLRCRALMALCPPPVICHPLPPPCRCPPPPPCISTCESTPMIENTCCVMCMDPCAFVARKRRDTTKEEFSLALKSTVDNPICNNMELKEVMEESMSNNISTSRKTIKELAETKLHDKFAVICARGEFSYSVYTKSFCQVRNEDLTCYAFKMPT